LPLQVFLELDYFIIVFFNAFEIWQWSTGKGVVLVWLLREFVLSNVFFFSFLFWVVFYSLIEAMRMS
jgi:hypothetical protein